MEKPATPRVVIVSAKVPPEHSGAGFAALKYAVRLDQRNDLCFLLTATGRPDSGWDSLDPSMMRLLRERTHHMGHRPIGARCSSLRKMWEFPFHGLRTFKILWRERNGYEIIHCFSPTWFSFFVAIAAKLLGKTLVVEITLPGGDCPETVAKHDWFRILHQRKMLQFRWADAIVCITPLLRLACLRAGLPEKKLYLIPRAVDLDKFAPVSKEEKMMIRRRLDLPERFTLFLFVGAIIERKGIDLLLPAFEKLAALDSEVGLVIVGPSYKSGEARLWDSRIRNLQAHSPIGSRIFYHGWQMNVNEYMQAADVFALPSRREGFGNVFIEAMATGLPVVSLHMPGVSDYIFEDGMDGFVTATPSSDALLAVMARAVACSRGEGADVGEAARRTVEARFSHDAIDALYQRLYHNLMSHASSKRRGLPAKSPIA